MSVEHETAVGAQPGESKKERVDRELHELLEEIRVALPGIELLLGFLLVLPFTERFHVLGNIDRGVYLGCFLVTAMCTALFVAPTAHHRLGFRRVDKEHLLARANKQILAGLALLGVSISASSYVVASVVVGAPWSYVIAGALAVWFTVWWFVARPHCIPEPTVH